jgi:DNA primase
VIPPEFIDEVLSRVDIIEIIEPRVALKKTGQNYSGLCPFHNEKTPSFSVSQDKQFYYCFGCQASGSALKFLLEFDRMDFVAAVEMLAERVGLEVPKDKNQPSSEATRRRKTIYEILEQASTIYQEELREHESRARAVDYLKARGLSGEVARDFSLGFAPPGWTNLYDKLANSNFERELLIDSGMVIDKQEEDKTYDRFRDRIMFPIRDLRGRTIAFGGRIIGDGKPKYLNSPETPVFHKGRELYGLYEARKRSAKLSRVLVVEGYMDVVALAQFGIDYSVATLGTATSIDHIDRLYRLVPQIVFCFDGDNAGRNAAWKALVISLQAMSDGRSAKFLFVPDGDDPDSLIRREGKEKFELRLDRASSLDEFFFTHLELDVDPSTMEGKASLSKSAMPLLNTIPNGVFKQLMIDELSQKTGLETSRLIEAAAQVPKFQARPSIPAAAPPPPDFQENSYPGIQESLADMALSMLVKQPELANEFPKSDFELLSQVPGYRFLAEIALLIRDEELLSPGHLMGYFQGKPDFQKIRALINQEQLLGVSELREEFKGTIVTLLSRFQIQLKQELIEQLISKPLSKLSPEERQLIKDSTRLSSKK